MKKFPQKKSEQAEKKHQNNIKRENRNFNSHILFKGVCLNFKEIFLLPKYFFNSLVSIQY